MTTIQVQRLLVFLVSTSLLAACVRRPCASSSVMGGTPLLQARFSVVSCCGGPRFIWNGTSCQEVAPLTLCGCDCTGQDCDKVFVTREACEQAYRHCE